MFEGNKSTLLDIRGDSVIIIVLVLVWKLPVHVNPLLLVDSLLPRMSSGWTLSGQL